MEALLDFGVLGSVVANIWAAYRVIDRLRALEVRVSRLERAVGLLP